jgi:hypothetical protein
VGSNIESKLIELNDDIYSSVDVQGYKCMTNLKDAMPVQFVINFNPPLMLTNLTFSPLELIEIDKPCTPEYKLKT